MRTNKKILSTFLAVLMTFSIFATLSFSPATSITAEAAPTVWNNPNGYSGLAASLYAKEWWNKRNPLWSNYDPQKSGGDCANFVSQCLYAGGLEMTKLWYCYEADATWYSGVAVAHEVSFAWVGAANLYQYLRNLPGVEQIRGDKINETKDFAIGDVLFYKWSGTLNTENSSIDHAAIVVDVMADGRPIVASHYRASNGTSYDNYGAEWTGGKGSYAPKQNIILIKMNGISVCTPNNRPTYNAYTPKSIAYVYDSINGRTTGHSFDTSTVLRITETNGSWGKLKVCRLGTNVVNLRYPTGRTENASEYWGWVRLGDLNHRGTVYSNPSGHSWGGWYMTQRGNCVTPNVERRDCLRTGCGHFETRQNGGGGHVPGSPATCLNPQPCMVCGIKLADPLGHDFRQYGVKPPTCLEAGEGLYSCTRCDEEITYLYTEWSEEYPEDIEENRIVSKQQHKIFTTSPAASLAGWTRYDTNTMWGDWSGWSQTDPGQSATRQRNSRLWGYNWRTVITRDPVTGPTSTLIRHYRSYSPADSWYDHYAPYEWHDYRGTISVAALNTMTVYAPGAYLSSPANCTGYNRDSVNGYADGSDVMIFPVSEIYEYQYRDRIYHYWQWADTQNGSTHNAAAGDPGNLERTLYRYTLDALGHNMGEWYLVTAATCTQKGLDRRDCTRCEYYEERETEIIGHSYIPEVAPPKCEEDGYTTHTCEHCMDSYVTDETDAIGHDWGEWYVLEQGECLDLLQRDCQREGCGAFEQDHINKQKHNHVPTETREPDCTNDGFTIKNCENCGHEIITDIVPALGHDMDYLSLDIDVLPQITGDDNPNICKIGSGHYNCRRCDYEENVPITEEHRFGDLFEAPPLCVESGSINAECEECGFVWIQDELEPTGHNYSDWGFYPEYGDKHATCTEDGQWSYHCTNPWCHIGVPGHWDKEIIPVHGHKPIDITETPPDCLNDGLTGGSSCAVCGEVFDEQEAIPALGHDWGEWYAVDDANCIETGLEQRDCQRCGIFETREPNALGHDMGEWYEVTPATCLEDGLERRDCQRDGCDHYVTRETDALNHDMGEWYIVTPATYEADGLARRDCVRIDECGYYETGPITKKFKDTDTGIEIEIPDPENPDDPPILPPGTEIVVTVVPDGYIKIGTGNSTKLKIEAAFDIKFILNGEEIQPNGKVIVRIPYLNVKDGGLYGVTPPVNSEWRVGRVEIDGAGNETVIPMEPVKPHSTLNSWSEYVKPYPERASDPAPPAGECYWEFYADHFSIYAIFSVEPDAPNTGCTCCDQHNHSNSFWDQIMCLICRIIQFFKSLFGVV
ncbi:MAG: amidase domain-containing protein [Oscillospiraceae bacterium]|nr:amidase domain-containing protein [Oscillospiraceae bacterium]